MKKRVLEIEKTSSQLPEWYWTYGLHDAKILSFVQMELPTDWKSKKPWQNCLEIRLNPAGAMTKIKKSCFITIL